MTGGVADAQGFFKGGSVATTLLPGSAGIRTNGGSEPPAYPSDAFAGDWSQTSQQARDFAAGFPDYARERPGALQLEVLGTFPQEVHGVLYRNGPGRLARGGHRYAHEFDGDGMVSRWEIRNGRVSFRSRFVRTREYAEEERAGRVLYRNAFGTQPRGGWAANFGDIRQRNVANTNVLRWGDRLHALWEAGQPHRLDPETLETLGLDTIGGQLQEGAGFSTGVEALDRLAEGVVGDPLTAHPKIDHKKGRLVSFGYRSKPSLGRLSKSQGAFDSEITIYEFDRDWEVVARKKVELPGFAFVHDFVLTESYYIFFQSPVAFNPIPFVIGERNPVELMEWTGSPSNPTLVHVVPRDSDTPVRVLEMPACFIFHAARGFEVGPDAVVVDAVVFPFLPPFASMGSPPDDRDNLAVRSRLSKVPAGRIERLALDLAGGTVEATRPRGRDFDLPAADLGMDPGSPHRYVYGTCAAGAGTQSPHQGVCRIDMETGEEVLHCPGPRIFTQEPVFVPRSKDRREGEGDGWLLLLANDAEFSRTGLFVYDAALLDEGPLGIAWLPPGEMLPFGLHGFFDPR